MTPTELAQELTAALIAEGLDEGSGPYSAFIQTAVQEALKVFSRHNQELADEFRRLAAEAMTENSGRFWRVSVAKAWEQAAQMVEEKLS